MVLQGVELQSDLKDTFLAFFIHEQECKCASVKS